MDEEKPRTNNHLYTFGPFRLDARERRLARDGAPVALVSKVFDLLLVLVENAGRLQTREELIKALWPATIVEEQGLSLKVHALRKALGDEDQQSPRYIETVRGHGYRFIYPVVVGGADVPAQAHAHGRRRWIAAGATLGVLAAIAGALTWRVGFAPSRHSRAAMASIAVLPFTNLSTEAANAYFAAGIQDEILTRLAAIGSLKVISRTSTQEYSSHPADLRSIARQLGVATILEGSVQKAGSEVHINVQLIDAGTLAHVWAQSYTRRLTNVFDIEREVAEEIATALDAKLTEAERDAITARPTGNPAAYDAYLRGLAYAARGSPALFTYADAVKSFTQAVQLDPRFAQAWARMSIIYAHEYQFGYDMTPEGLAKVRDAARRALELAPDLGEAWLAEGFYQYVQQNYRGALATFEKAQARLPNDAEAPYAMGLAERRLGHWSEALSYQQQGARLDPRNVEMLVQLALTYSATRQFDRGHDLLNQALDVIPDRPITLATDAALFQAEGKLDAAEKQLTTLAPQPDSWVVFGAEVRQLLYRRNYKAAATDLQAGIAKSGPALGDNVGYYYAMLGLAEQRMGDAKGARAAYLQGRAALLALRQRGDQSYRVAAHLGLIEAALGDGNAARRDGEQAVELTRQDEIYGPGLRENLAEIYAQLGDTDAALAILPTLLRTSYLNVMTGTPLTPALLRIDPFWDALRKDQRFRALLSHGGAHGGAQSSPLDSSNYRDSSWADHPAREVPTSASGLPTSQ